MLLPAQKFHFFRCLLVIFAAGESQRGSSLQTLLCKDQLEHSLEEAFGRVVGPYGGLGGDPMKRSPSTNSGSDVFWRGGHEAL